MKQKSDHFSGQLVYVTGQAGAAAQDGYFMSFITSPVSPVVFALLFMAATAAPPTGNIQFASQVWNFCPTGTKIMRAAEVQSFCQKSASFLGR